MTTTPPIAEDALGPSFPFDLKAEHAHLDSLFNALLESYQSGLWDDVRARWNEAELALRAHMAREEEQIFPTLRDADAEETNALLREHVALGERLAAVGLALELHAVPLGDMEALVAQSRAHSLREDSFLQAFVARVSPRP